MRTTSYEARASASTASRPLPATCASMPSLASCRDATSWFTGLSSARRTRMPGRSGSTTRPAGAWAAGRSASRPSAAWRASWSSEARTGFVRQRSTPASRARSASSRMPNAVRRMTATPASAASALMRRVSSTPSMSGMTRSTTATRDPARDADPGVRDLEAHENAPADRVDPEGDLALLGELYGVADEVVEHLSQAPGVARHDGREGRGDEAAELDLLLPRADGEELRHLLDRLAQLEVDLLEVEPSGLDLREVEDVVEDAEERLARGARRVCAIPLLGREVRLEEQPDHPDHAVHRGADLVAHGGDEGRLRPRSALGRAQRLLQRAGVQGVLDAEPLALAERADPHGLDDRADHRGGDEAARKAHHLAGGRERRHQGDEAPHDERPPHERAPDHEREPGR